MYFFIFIQGQLVGNLFHFNSCHIRKYEASIANFDNIECKNLLEYLTLNYVNLNRNRVVETTGENFGKDLNLYGYGKCFYHSRFDRIDFAIFNIPILYFLS